MSWAVFDPGAAHMSRICIEAHVQEHSEKTAHNTSNSVGTLEASSDFHLVVGLNLQEKRRDHADSLLPTDVTLRGPKVFYRDLKAPHVKLWFSSTHEAVGDISVWLTDSVSLTRNWWNFSSRGDFLMIFLLMLVCQACSSGYLEVIEKGLKFISTLNLKNIMKSYHLRGWGASIFWPSISSSRISLKYLSFRQWRISLAWLEQMPVWLITIYTYMYSICYYWIITRLVSLTCRFSIISGN